ncbi:group III truncated hemoglobin [Acuticoccus sp. M5D2P5]|uniref:group III truncated hemoglobin n=1 Tax=Acuticoccus kalidii TaxID=2910977 RepID=UPI001F45ACFB|nr:group III truncated hemoglobin [Acuticoccus kalidii]MCF3934899.1 group III truncated hemoglobin [Acuticoccus kalidii]
MTAHESETIPIVASSRPEMTAAIMEETGLDEAVLRTLVHRFYAKIRADDLLGPIFAARITDWARHLERMVGFWCSVALMTGSYHGRPVPLHAPLPVEAAHFAHWLMLFRETAHEVCTPAGADHVIERAERIARSLQMAVELTAARREAAASLRDPRGAAPGRVPVAGGG